MGIIDWWRLLYSIAAAIILVLVGKEFRTRLELMSREQLYWSLALVGFLFTGLVASLESLYFDDHLSIRTPLYTACSFWCALALWVGHKDNERGK